MWVLRRKYEKLEAEKESNEISRKCARIEEEAKSDTESEDEKTPMESWWEEV